MHGTKAQSPTPTQTTNSCRRTKEKGLLLSTLDLTERHSSPPHIKMCLNQLPLWLGRKNALGSNLGGEVEIEKGGLISHPQTSPPLAGPEGRVRGNNGQEILRAHHGSPGKEEDKDNYFKAITSFNSAPTPTPVLLMGINSGPDTFSGAQYMVLERGGAKGLFPSKPPDWPFEIDWLYIFKGLLRWQLLQLHKDPCCVTEGKLQRPFSPPTAALL